MVAFLAKSIGSEGFYQVIDFLARSHICYALTKKPVVSVLFIKQFWRSAEASTDDNGEVKIIATIDGHSMTITEASLRRHLKLDDNDGSTKKIFKPGKLLYVPTMIVVTVKTFHFYFKISSSPPTLLNLSPSPEPSHSPESFIMEHSPDHTCCTKTQPITKTQPSPTQPSPGVEQHFPTPHDSPLHAVHSHGSDEGSLKLNEFMNLVTKLSNRVVVLEDDLRKTKKTYSSTLTKLILRVKKLEARVKIGKSRKRAKVVLSEDDADVQDDSSKQGRKLSDAEVKEKASTKTEPIMQEVTPTEFIQDQGSSEKGSAEISTAGATKGTASEVPVVSTAEENISIAGRTITYRRRSEEQRTRKDKGKANNEQSLSQRKKSRKGAEQGKKEKDADTQKEMKEVVKESGAKRKKYLPRKRRTVKRQKLEEDAEKEELKTIWPSMHHVFTMKHWLVQSKRLLSVKPYIYVDLGVMELENSQNNALAKLPMLKLGEYEMWEIRIKQYFQIQDYAHMEVIENGKFVEKICKKNDVKARSLLLMALPNEHHRFIT
ncbi:hypothetical protein Tco_0185974 [Tanacetum coccineum]